MIIRSGRSPVPNQPTAHEQRSAALDCADAWAPPLDNGFWRARYAQCCDAVLAYDRIVATMPPGGLRDQLVALRPATVDLLGRAWTLAELGTALLPAGPGRDPRLLDLLADDRLGDLRRVVAEPPPDPGLGKALLAVRDELWRVAEDAARLAVRVHERPDDTNLTEYLRGLADGVVAARMAGRTS